MSIFSSFLNGNKRLRIGHRQFFRSESWVKATRVFISATVIVTSISLTACSRPTRGEIASIKTKSLPQANSPLPLRQFKMMNYYPSDGGWTEMWTKWNPIQINADFVKISAMGANVVRVILPTLTFGFPVPSSTYLSRLHEVVSLAAKNRLRVDLTLFDLWRNVSDLNGSSTWMTDILEGYKSDPEIAFIELKNEAPVTVPSVATWVKSEFPILRYLAGTDPITVSLTTNPALTELHALHSLLYSDPPSFYDIHVYDNPGIAYSEIADAKALVAPVPIYVGETGASTFVSPGTDSFLQDANQSFYYQGIEWDTKELGIPPAAPWIYSDFTSSGIPSTVKMNSLGYDFGLFTSAGTPKPAERVVSKFFKAGIVSTDFNGDFSNGSDGRPADWQIYCGNQGNLLWSPSKGHNRLGSVELSLTTGSSTCWPSFVVDPIVGITSKGESFKVTAYCEGRSASGTTELGISWFASNGDYLGRVTSKPLTSGNSTWTQLSAEGSAPSGAAFPQISIASAHDGGSVWCDDVSWQPLGR